MLFILDYVKLYLHDILMSTMFLSVTMVNNKTVCSMFRFSESSGLPQIIFLELSTSFGSFFVEHEAIFNLDSYSTLLANTFVVSCQISDRNDILTCWQKCLFYVDPLRFK